MMYLIAVLTTFTQQKVDMYVVGEDANIDEIKAEIESNLCSGVQVSYYTGYNDRLVEPDSYNYVRMMDDND